MGAFFLHRATYSELTKLHPKVFEESRSKDTRSDAKSSGIDKFGWRGMIYEVADRGGIGKVEDCENAKIYDFMHYLSWIRANQKRDELSAARLGAQG